MQAADTKNSDGTRKRVDCVINDKEPHMYLKIIVIQSINDPTWNNIDGQLLEYFVRESVLLREEVDFGAELPLEPVEHGVFDHEVAQLTIREEHDVRGAAEVLVDVSIGGLSV